MKTQSLIIALTICLMACQSKKEVETEFETAVCDMTLAAPACSAPPPVYETVKFVPPNIVDDAIEDGGVTKTNKQDGLKTKKIIKDGSICIKVKNVESSKKRIDDIVKSYNCYYENEGFSNSEIRVAYNLKIRIPAKQFESFLKATEKGDGEIISKTIDARDVTEDYVDGEIRLNSKRLFRNRYNQLLEKAAKVDDILAIEENIRTLQEEIESQEGHLKFLDDQILYSTLEINLFRDKEITNTPVLKDSFFKRLLESISNGWNTLVSFVLWCMMQWPWGILIITVLLAIKFYIKRRQK